MAGTIALEILQGERVAILKADSSYVREVVGAYREGRLHELTEGCHQARHSKAEGDGPMKVDSLIIRNQ